MCTRRGRTSASGPCSCLTRRAGSSPWRCAICMWAALRLLEAAMGSRELEMEKELEEERVEELEKRHR